jgi:two-component system, NarL family, sensor kinase
LTPLQNNSDILVSIIAGSLLLFLLCVFIVTFAALFFKKRRQHKAEQQNLQVQFAETLLRSQLEIREQTLQYFAGELHDNIGQIASLIKINLATLRINDPDEATKQIEDTKDLVRRLLTDLKLLSVSLNSDLVAHVGLISSIESEVVRLNKSGRFNAIVERDADPPELSSNKTIILFRMVQEILNNIVKHSEAQRVFIRFHKVENLFILVIADDGVGFIMEERIRSGGSGLINLRNRAKLIEAKLSIESSPLSGTTVTIEIPE